jgi:hypothetical protein
VRGVLVGIGTGDQTQGLSHARQDPKKPFFFFFESQFCLFKILPLFFRASVPSLVKQENATYHTEWGKAKCLQNTL